MSTPLFIRQGVIGALEIADTDVVADTALPIGPSQVTIPTEDTLIEEILFLHQSLAAASAELVIYLTPPSGSAIAILRYPVESDGTYYPEDRFDFGITIPAGWKLSATHNATGTLNVIAVGGVVR